jgi:hypothetical protein
VHQLRERQIRVTAGLLLQVCADPLAIIHIVSHRGLGLAYVRRQVCWHGGDVGIAPQEGNLRRQRLDTLSKG